MSRAGESRGRFVLNLVSNQIGFLLPAIITFFLSPFVVHSLGDHLYGLWSLVVSFGGHYGLLTMGMQSAATRYVAHAVGKGDRASLQKFVNAGFALLVPAAVLATLAGAVLALLLEPLFRIPREDLTGAQIACVLLAVSTGITFATAIFSALLTAHQRFDSLNVVKISSIIVRALFTVWLLSEGHGIVALAWLALLIAGASGVGFLGLARLQCPGWKIDRRALDREAMGTLTKFGAKSLIGTASLTLAYQSDLFVIGIFLAPEEITIYALGSTLLFYVVQFVNSIVHVLDPYATERFARDGVKGLRELFLTGSTFLYGLGGLIVGGAIAFAEPFFAVWISPEHTRSGWILAILVIPQFFNIGARFGHSILVGMARIGTFNAAALIGGVVNLGLSFVLIQFWGLEGVALATLIPMVLVDGVWFVPYISRVLGVSPWRLYGVHMLPGAVVAATTCLSGLGIQQVLPATNWVALGGGVLVAATCGVLSALAVLHGRIDGQDWRRWAGRNLASRFSAPRTSPDGPEA